ncbi:hypothetical protein CEXT_652261 [Caerostris extrusa]|uniref:Uncharacterized protein n=1 Tax=Caerostris extrusa TaxID=172846 RepID=A0AAV4MCZ8_CAEEX|nr:hypothetical protein CEXT_652261 [Caerostris extrusa]
MRSSRHEEEENRTSEEEQMDLPDFDKSSWLSDSLDEVFTVTGSIQFTGFTESDSILSEGGCCVGYRVERG